MPHLVEDANGCALSPTLARRAEAGLAPGLFAPMNSAAVRRVVATSRVMRGQQAVEEALGLVDESGHPLHAGYLLCSHLMPSPWFGRRDLGEVKPDDDLVEGGMLEAFRKFEAALCRMRELHLRGELDLG